MVNNKIQIKKILNNNVVIANDSLNHEVIAIGNGIGFRHNAYDLISQTEVKKIYYLDNNLSRRKLLTIFDEIPFKIIEITEEIIHDAEIKLNVKLNENLVISLADHINFTVKRFKEGFEQPILVNEEIKRFYREEYEFGISAVKKINYEFEINISQEEASSIAFHILNAMHGKSGQETIKILEGVKDILKIVSCNLGITYDEESLDYSRFIIHLKYVMKKIYWKNKVTNVYYSKQISQNLLCGHEDVASCLDKIAIYIKDKHNYALTDEDKLYLIIHIIKLLGD